MQLSRRLDAILQMIPRAPVLADIGTDHGKLPIAAIESGKIKRAIATDKSGPSLAKAIEASKEAGIKHLIECREGDGLQVIRLGEVDVIVMAGMGGGRMIKILEPNRAIWARARLILQPNRDVEALRRWLDENGVGLTAENVVQDGKRFYTILSAQIVGSWMVEASYSVLGWDKDTLVEVGPYLLQHGGDEVEGYYKYRIASITKDLKKAPEGTESHTKLAWTLSCYERALKSLKS